jgi:DNA polymerase III subunit epsilon
MADGWGQLLPAAVVRRAAEGGAHKSYGLGALCEIYGVNLENHHRALCDARAAASLLNLINEKRDICQDAGSVAA